MRTFEISNGFNVSAEQILNRINSKVLVNKDGVIKNVRVVRVGEPVELADRDGMFVIVNTNAVTPFQHAKAIEDLKAAMAADDQEIADDLARQAWNTGMSKSYPSDWTNIPAVGPCSLEVSTYETKAGESALGIDRINGVVAVEAKKVTKMTLEQLLAQTAPASLA